MWPRLVTGWSGSQLWLNKSYRLHGFGKKSGAMISIHGNREAALTCKILGARGDQIARMNTVPLEKKRCHGYRIKIKLAQ